MQLWTGNLKVVKEFSSGCHVFAVRSLCGCQMGLCVVVIVWLSNGSLCGCCLVVIWLLCGCRVVVV